MEKFSIEALEFEQKKQEALLEVARLRKKELNLNQPQRKREKQKSNL